MAKASQKITKKTTTTIKKKSNSKCKSCGKFIKKP